MLMLYRCFVALLRNNIVEITMINNRIVVKRNIVRTLTIMAVLIMVMLVSFYSITTNRYINSNRGVYNIVQIEKSE